MIFGIIAVVIIALIVVWVIVTYNALVRAREFTRNGMGQIAAQVESRWDAVSSLIEATKRYSEHEATTLREATAARTSITRSAEPTDVDQDDARFNSVLGRINAVAEAYPELRVRDLPIDDEPHRRV